jgi:hypothetical protein
MSMDFTELFAGVRGRDIVDARAWYQRRAASLSRLRELIRADA